MTAPRRFVPDGSLWGPDVCRCGDHVDPHRHVLPGPGNSVSIYDESDETRRTVWHTPSAFWPYGSYPLVRVPKNPGKHPGESDENGEKWAVLTTVLVCFTLGVAALAAAAYVWLS